MERKEFSITGTVKTVPMETEMDIVVDTTNMDFGSPAAGQASQVVSRTMTITGNTGVVRVSVGATDWVATDRTMAGNVTEVSVGSGEYVPLVVAGEVMLGEFAEGAHMLNFRVTPPGDIDLNTYEQKIVVIGE